MNTSVQVGETVIELSVTREACVADAVAVVAREHVPAGEVISAIYLNEIFWQADWEGELADVRIDQVESIRFETMSPADAATEGLRDLEQIVELAQKRFAQAADDLRFGDHAKGLLVFASGADILRDAMQFVGLYADHLRLPPSHPALAMAAQAEAQVVAAMPAFEQAQAAEDWGQLADVVEYEVSASLDHLRGAKAALGMRSVAPPPQVLGAA
jgi:hypothetical protein